jgi:hypothetical protein
MADIRLPGECPHFVSFFDASSFPFDGAVFKAPRHQGMRVSALFLMASSLEEAIMVLIGSPAWVQVSGQMQVLFSGNLRPCRFLPTMKYRLGCPRPRFPVRS